MTTSRELKQFVAITIYMGIVNLPSKRDYWPIHPILSSHSVTNELSWNRFEIVWQNLHLTELANVNLSSDESEEEVVQTYSNEKSLV